MNAGGVSLSQRAAAVGAVAKGRGRLAARGGAWGVAAGLAFAIAYDYSKLVACFEPRKATTMIGSAPSAASPSADDAGWSSVTAAAFSLPAAVSAHATASGA